MLYKHDVCILKPFNNHGFSNLLYSLAILLFNSIHHLFLLKYLILLNVDLLPDLLRFEDILMNNKVLKSQANRPQLLKIDLSNYCLHFRL